MAEAVRVQQALQSRGRRREVEAGDRRRAALARVLASLVPAAYLPGLHLAGLAWGGAFLAYVVRYGPMLLGPRVTRAAPLAGAR
jgi:hypothetical protein